MSTLDCNASAITLTLRLSSMPANLIKTTRIPISSESRTARPTRFVFEIGEFKYSRIAFERRASHVLK